MSNATTVAAVAGGYLLGRTKKMKLALMLAAMLAGKKLPTSGSGLTSQLNDLVQSSPELSNLMKEIQGNLTQAARAAAVTAATQQVNKLSDNLHSRAEGLRSLGQGEEGQDGEDSEESDTSESESSQDEQSQESSDSEDQAQDEDVESDEPDEEDESTEESEDESDEPDEDESDEPDTEEQPDEKSEDESDKPKGKGKKR